MTRKFLVTLEFEVPVESLAAYSADTIEEAAENAVSWINVGYASVSDLLLSAESMNLSIEGVED